MSVLPYDVYLLRICEELFLVLDVFFNFFLKCKHNSLLICY